MRASIRVLALAAPVALLALGACNRVPPAAKVALPPLPAVDPEPAGPQMTAGLWRQRVAGPQGVSVTRYCLDAAAAGALASFNGQLSGHCSQHQMALQTDGAWHFRTTCDTAVGSVTTEGSMRGDFARHYVVQASQASTHGATHVTADVQRLGDCPSDIKPGDVILPGGAKSQVGALASGD